MLSDSEDEIQNEEEHKITINEHYAKAFQYRKEREELEKLKAKLGSDVSESDLEEEETDSESAESEDEDGEELTATVDAAILRTLARIRRKDPSIYDSSKGVFGEEQENLSAKAAFTAPGKSKKKDSAKPVTLRQAALEAQLALSRSASPEPLTHVQEQVSLRKETISAFHTAANGGEEEEDDLLVPREKTKDDLEQEDEEYRAFLQREVGDLKDIIGFGDDTVKSDGEPEEDGAGEDDNKKKKKRKKNKGADRVVSKRKSKEDEEKEFLMNYILNRGWIDKSADRVPTYKEITSKSKLKKSKTSQADEHPSDGSFPSSEAEEDQALHSDTSFESLNDAFESSYNFRFEEPNSSTISSFPRSIPSLVRREDSKRKDARERRKQRKEEEMEKKREEVRRLKALKMREIRRKLEAIGREGGILGSKKPSGKGKGKSVRWEDDDGGEEGEMDDALKELDLEGDWDPEKHDQQMAGLYDGDGDGDGEWEDNGEVDEDGKPIWKDDIDIGDIRMSDDDEEDVMDKNDKNDKKDKKKKKKGGEDDYENLALGVDIGTTDADGQAPEKEMGEEEERDGTEEMRKHKLGDYMEEVYNLDFNDMVGDLPTRFKYAPVAPQAYSLTPVEILLATDKELNEFMSIKRYAPYKNDARKWDAKRQQKLKELKQSLVERSKNGGWLTKDSHNNGGGGSSGTAAGAGRPGEEDHKPKKRKGKKERMKAKAAAVAEGGRVDDEAEGAGVDADAGGGENGKMQIGEVVEANSVGANVESKKSKKEKKKHEQSMDLDGEQESGNLRGKGHKRKRNNEEEGEGQESQTSPRQHRAKTKDEREDESDKPKKKRRRKHKKGGGEGGVDAE